MTMSQIIVEHNPSEDKLKQLGVSSWEIWEKEVSKFPLDFGMTEAPICWKAKSMSRRRAVKRW